MTQEVLKLALEALERSVATCFDQYAHQQVMSQPDHFINKAITAIKEALRKHAMREVQRLGQEIEQEPVAHWSDCGVHNEPAYPAGECDCGGFNPTAWLVEDTDGPRLYWTYKEPIGNEKWTPLFATPPQRTWVGLTDEEILAEIPITTYRQVTSFARAIEAKLKERNT
jgi:hypothetical protein